MATWNGRSGRWGEYGSAGWCDGHECVVFDMSPKVVADMGREGDRRLSSLQDMVSKLRAAAVWMRFGGSVEKTIEAIARILKPATS